MGLQIKTHIASKVLDCLKEYGDKQVLRNFVYENLRISLHNGSDITVSLPLSSLKSQGVSADLSRLKEDGPIQSISKRSLSGKDFLTFLVDKSQFTCSCLKEIESLSFPTIPKERIVIDYSSPNIAKPFHIGHFRSTIIGNFISNISKFTQSDTTRLNYLGDWGTQFGLLKIGIKISGMTDNQIKENPVQNLYEAYVKGNAAAEENSSLYVKAREEFTSLEKGLSMENLDSWELYKKYTVQELATTYRRLNVIFDDYSWESEYAAHRIQDVLSQLSSITTVKEDGLQVVELGDNKEIPVLKSDGSTLYLTRDIAAAIDRHKKYNFSKMFYVVDRSQVSHFNSLFKILNQLNYPWTENLVHVQFGRIRNMSTRKGEVVFLSDVLDEAKEFMMQKQKQTHTTKDLSYSVADDLGISALIVHDLKQKRNKDYIFNWDTIFGADGDTGTQLQYTHCRLVSLEQKVDLPLPLQCDPSILIEPEAVALIAQIAVFDETVIRSYHSLEACLLVHYLFQLCNCTGRALQALRVKDNPTHIASQRLLMFHTARVVLNQGMKILGLKPLDYM